MEGGAYDEALIQIASQHDSIEALIDTFMSFLDRRTDFFDIMQSKSDSKGFPAGVSETILLNRFRSIQQTRLLRPSLRQASRTRDTSPASRSASGINAVGYSQSLTKRPFNGGTTDRYSWSQTDSEVTVDFLLPSDISPATLRVDILSTSVTISIASSASPCEILELPFPISAGDSTWTVNDGIVTMFLEKKEMRWWSCLDRRGPHIDLKSISSSKRIEELPEANQSVVRKLLAESIPGQ